LAISHWKEKEKKYAAKDSLWELSSIMENGCKRNWSPDLRLVWLVAHSRGRNRGCLRWRPRSTALQLRLGNPVLPSTATLQKRNGFELLPDLWATLLEQRLSQKFLRIPSTKKDKANIWKERSRLQIQEALTHGRESFFDGMWLSNYT
jgi:hypothetical protein